MPLLTLMLLSTLDAQAQDTPAVPDLNAQLYRVPVDAERTLWTDDSATAPTGYWRLKAALHYARNPLTYRYADGSEDQILQDALQGDVIAAVNVSRLRIGLDLPVWLLTTSDLAGGGAGLGDIGVDLKGTLVDRGDEPGFGLALGARLDLPTASVDLPVGNPGLGWSAQVIADYNTGPVLLAANLGTQGVPTTTLSNGEWDDQFFYRLGAGFSLDEDDRGGLSLDLAGRAAYGGPEGASAPLEVLGGGWFTLGESWVVRSGVGTGLTRGIGAPDFRGVLTVGWEPPKNPDRDMDGILDRNDACRDEPEDFDQWQDADGCPDPTTAVTIRLVDARGELLRRGESSVQTHAGERSGGNPLAVELHAGEWTIEASAPRFGGKTATITVPEAEAHVVEISLAPTFGSISVTVTDPDGAPLDAVARVGPRGDKIPAPGGAATLEADAGEVRLVVQAPGFKPYREPVVVLAGKDTAVVVVLESSKAKVTKEKIEILDKVYFDTAKATIKKESFELLGDVAALLEANPDVRKVRVEGHTDIRGNDKTNLKLSQDRADSVRQWLIDNGIAAERLDAVGYGEDRPVDPARTQTAYDKNRRVEFVIVERDAE